MITPDLTLTVPRQLGVVHFVGIGGSGMSGIARLFLEAGMTVTGSDLRDSKTVESLRALGAIIHIGHDAKNVADADTLVVTSALWPENPEYLFAEQRGLPILHRSQALAWLINDRRLVAVAGAHGKTTSTGMLVTALGHLGAEPSFVNGGVISELGVSSAWGQGETFVVEADESDGSFLLYDTSVALITNVDSDHLDHYGSVTAVEDAFVSFAQSASDCVVISCDDEGAERIRSRLSSSPSSRILTFGYAKNADVRLHSVHSASVVSFSLDYREKTYSARLTLPGAHNAVNAAGVFAVLVAMGHKPQNSIAAISQFAGTGRRFEWHAAINGVSVYDDYAHHPTEVVAALTAARAVVGEGRIVAVHQPHLYSRTQMFAQEFADALERVADFTIVLEVCGAREDPIPGVTGELVSERFSDHRNVVFCQSWQQAAQEAAAYATAGDVLITLGCGDVNLIIPLLCEALEQKADETAQG